MGAVPAAPGVKIGLCFWQSREESRANDSDDSRIRLKLNQNMKSLGGVCGFKMRSHRDLIRSPEWG
ncbi:hypothetical protein [Ancylobacter polymorphus]|uniref:Uncharacterized protein n=1 Tax=Ancylobacter polymorphus TaxID=223390 RepID=A0ABU0BDV1_9HYPH|nr:hypothetical protein [Ancylobacter polymorphus]MDQ0303769.1 hypothetical protein [Ancylobacter polymorphus]